MRVPHHLVRHENGGFQFRKRIPTHLRPIFGGRLAVKQSLRTHCLDTAKARAMLLSLRYDEIFSSIGMDMAKPTIDDFPHLFQDAKAVKQYKARMTANGETEITTDGTAEDHARALEFLKAKTAADIELEALRLAKAEAEARVRQTKLAAASAEAKEIADAMKPAAPSATFKRLQMAEALKLYEEATATKEAKDQKQALKAVSDFATHAKVEYLDEISRPQVNAWITHLRDKVGNSNATLKNKVEFRLKQFIEWAMGAGYYPKGDNPATGHKTISKRKQTLVASDDGSESGFSPFTMEEVAHLIDPGNLRRCKLSQDTIWALLLGVFTGARPAEIGQLYLNDIAPDKDGVLVLRVDVLNPHQSVKTLSSKRKIPIHPTLIELGLVDRMKALKDRKQKRLFPAFTLTTQNGAGAVSGSRFTRYRKKLKLPMTDGRKLGLHSLRKTFIHELAQTEFNGDRRRRYVGHEVPGVDFVDYVKFFRPSILLKDLETYWHPPIDVEGVKELLKDLGPLEHIKREQRQRAKSKTPSEKT